MSIDKNCKLHSGLKDKEAYVLHLLGEVKELKRGKAEHDCYKDESHCTSRKLDEDTYNEKELLPEILMDNVFTNI